MPVNRILISFLSALLVAFSTGAAMSAPSLPPYTPADIGAPGEYVGVPSGDNLGFGKYLGTWLTGADVTTTSAPGDAMPNTNPSGGNAEAVGSAILAQYPGLFDINEFNWAGAGDGFPSFSNEPGGGFQIDSVVSSYGGGAIAAKWIYTGFDPLDYPELGDDPVDLFVSVKYGQYISFFMYEAVAPNQYGYVTTDFRVILNETPATATRPGSLALLRDELNYNGLDDFYNSGSGRNSCNVVVSGNFNDECMPYNGSPRQPTGTGPIGISHVTAYWPPARVPEPSPVGLVGLGIISLLLTARLRSASSRSTQS